MKKYDNYVSHLTILEQAPGEDLTNEFIISGIIDKFSLQFELSWKVLKELLLYEGKSEGHTGSPREIIKAAYVCFDFIEEEVWLSMLKDRNDTAHIYSKELSLGLLKRILEQHIPAFQRLKDRIDRHYGEILNEL